VARDEGDVAFKTLTDGIAERLPEGGHHRERSRLGKLSEGGSLIKARFEDDTTKCPLDAVGKQFLHTIRRPRLRGLPEELELKTVEEIRRERVQSSDERQEALALLEPSEEDDALDVSVPAPA